MSSRYWSCSSLVLKYLSQGLLKPSEDGMEVWGHMTQGLRYHWETNSSCLSHSTPEHTLTRVIFFQALAFTSRSYTLYLKNDCGGAGYSTMLEYLFLFSSSDSCLQFLYHLCFSVLPSSTYMELPMNWKFVKDFCVRKF